MKSAPTLGTGIFLFARSYAYAKNYDLKYDKKTISQTCSNWYKYALEKKKGQTLTPNTEIIVDFASLIFLLLKKKPPLFERTDTPPMPSAYSDIPPTLINEEISLEYTLRAIRQKGLIVDVAFERKLEILYSLNQAPTFELIKGHLGKITRPPAPGELF
jgi:hypothetical protein